MQYLNSLDVNSVNFALTFSHTEFPSSHKYVEIRNSKIHGRGVFAICDISKNTFITHYPAHFVGYKSDIIGYKNKKPNNNYKYKTKHGYDIYGDPDKCKDSWFLGHMINDANCIKLSKRNLNRNTIKDVVNNYIDLRCRNNCKFENLEPTLLKKIVTSRDIKENEEILVEYDVPYWLTKEQFIILIDICIKDKEMEKKFIT